MKKIIKDKNFICFSCTKEIYTLYKINSTIKYPFGFFNNIRDRNLRTLYMSIDSCINEHIRKSLL